MPPSTPLGTGSTLTGPFDALLRENGFVMFDGGLSAELERRGADLSDELWSARLLLDDPQAIAQVHLDSLRAGADVVSSASYQASRAGFARRGLSEREADATLAEAVRLAREACERFATERHRATPPLVAASLGPYGATLADGSEYRGDDPLAVEELVAFHRPRVDAVLAAKPDLVLFETIPSLREGEAIARLARATPGVSFMVSFSAVTARGIAHGEPFADAVRLLEGLPNVAAVGLNCAPPEVIEALLRSVTSHRVLLAARPNSGERWSDMLRRWEGQDAAASDDASTRGRLVSCALRSFDAGARVIGGCCRVRPEDLAAMRHALEHR